MAERAKRPGDGFRALTANVTPRRGGVNTQPNSRRRGVPRWNESPGAEFSQGQRGHRAADEDRPDCPADRKLSARLYGGTERIVSYLTEELVRQGHDVTLFASGDSCTSARLEPFCEIALRLDPRVKDPIPHHIVMLDKVRGDGRPSSTCCISMSTCCTIRHPAQLRRRDGDDAARAARSPGAEAGLLDLRPRALGFDLERSAQADAAGQLGGQRSITACRATSCRSTPTPQGGYLAFLGRISPGEATRPRNRDRDARRREAQDGGEDRPRRSGLLGRGRSSRWSKRIRTSSSSARSTSARRRNSSAKRRALLFPIDWPEPFGLVMIEAMACGTPVIAFRRGSTPEVIDDGVTGFLVDDVDRPPSRPSRASATSIGRRARASSIGASRSSASPTTISSIYRALPGVADAPHRAPQTTTGPWTAGGGKSRRRADPAQAGAAATLGVCEPPNAVRRTEQRIATDRRRLVDQLIVTTPSRRRGRARRRRRRGWRAEPRRRPCPPGQAQAPSARSRRESPGSIGSRKMMRLRAALEGEAEAGLEQIERRGRRPGLRTAGDRIEGRPAAPLARKAAEELRQPAQIDIGRGARTGSRTCAPPRAGSRSGRSPRRSAHCHAARPSRCDSSSDCSALRSRRWCGCPSRRSSSCPSACATTAPRAFGQGDAGEQRMAGVGGAHPAGLLVAVERQHIGAELLVEEELVEARGASPPPSRRTRPPGRARPSRRAIRSAARQAA